MVALMDRLCPAQVCSAHSDHFQVLEVSGYPIFTIERVTTGQEIFLLQLLLPPRQFLLFDFLTTGQEAQVNSKPKESATGNFSTPLTVKR